MSFPITPFTIHDLRRAGSTILHEQGLSPDVVEKAFNHDTGGVRGVYNRAQYAYQLEAMLQSWANYVSGLLEAAESKPAMNDDKPRNRNEAPCFASPKIVLRHHPIKGHRMLTAQFQPWLLRSIEEGTLRHVAGARDLADLLGPAPNDFTPERTSIHYNDLVEWLIAQGYVDRLGRSNAGPNLLKDEQDELTFAEEVETCHNAFDYAG